MGNIVTSYDNYRTACHYLQRQGFQRKKGVRHDPHLTDDPAVFAEWCRMHQHHEMRSALDEAAVYLYNTRSWGRAKRGERVCVSKPTHSPRFTMLVYVRDNPPVLTTVLFPTKSMTDEDFEREFFKHVEPDLVEEEHVIMDNLGKRSGKTMHYNKKVRAAIRRKGGRVCFTVEYCPFLDPCESAIAWIKRGLESIQEKEGTATNWEELARRVERRTNEADQHVIHSWFLYRGTQRSLEEEYLGPSRRKQAAEPEQRRRSVPYELRTRPLNEICNE
jgi:transposase